MNNYQRFAVISVGCLLMFDISKAQIQSIPTPTQLMSIEVDGVRTRKYGNVDVDGSPFLTDGWANGIATTDKGENFEGSLRYDIVTDQLVFAGKDSVMMLFNAPIVRFTLSDDTYQNGFPAVEDWKDKTYYKTLGAGKSKILKHFYKKKIEVRDIGGISNYKYEDNVACYLFKDAKMVKLKPNKSAIIAALADKKSEVEAFVKNNKIDFKQDTDVAKLMNYYNSL
ncbi:hypothetical protein [Mucilaginibacter terrae]|uniref:Uncharacterized protein n=1 Tax=Mucilaginibacter terrae TaxID=1955052 RepID=A0ABU3GPA8_9SPHI|nr:hypothetical protein [Mucilaginibacter terrae]MDT3401624.1 hypothetical protein [Mucilaginibacter terrae]